jgi:hypothetical protein
MVHHSGNEEQEVIPCFTDCVRHFIRDVEPINKKGLDNGTYDHHQEVQGPDSENTLQVKTFYRNFLSFTAFAQKQVSDQKSAENEEETYGIRPVIEKSKTFEVEARGLYATIPRDEAPPGTPQKNAVSSTP